MRRQPRQRTSLAFTQHAPRRILVAAGMMMAVAFALTMLLDSRLPAWAAPGTPFEGTVASSQVHVVLDLGDAALHPRQVVYDASRQGLWFWTSRIIGQGTTYENTLYYYGTTNHQLKSWPLYAGDWSSQLLAGLAVAPDGEIWIGWNANLLRFDPASGSYVRYVLPARSQYSLPANVVGSLPTNLGIADLAVAQDETVWIARYADLSLTAFSPASATFTEYPLPQATGDPARLVISPDGHILFTTDLAASHPGHSEETMGDFNPQTAATMVIQQSGRTLAVGPSGDTYIAVGHGAGLAMLPARARAAAEQAQTGATPFQRVSPFDIDDAAIATDDQGHIWVAVAGQPDLARIDPVHGTIQEYQYAALSVAAHPITDLPLGIVPTAPAPGAVWITHIVAMACDGQGNLWYFRAGSSQLEEVTPGQ